MISPPVSILFFDCWYTLFTADLGDDLRQITTQLGVSYNTSFIKAFERAFMVEPERDQRRNVVRLITALGRPVEDALLASIVNIIEKGFDRQRPYPDTLEQLERLRGRYRLGLISNSSQIAFEHLSRTFKLTDRFDVLVPSYEARAIKPDPQIFQYALDQAGVAASQAIMIGDSPSDDYQGSLRAGFASAILIDRRNRQIGHAHRITELVEVEPTLRQLSVANR